MPTIASKQSSKKSRYSFKLFFLLMLCFIYKAQAQEGYRLYKETVQGKEKLGIVDGNGNKITAAKYDWIDDSYSEGFIAAYISELKTVDNSNLAFAPAKTGYFWWHNYGYIDVKGKEVTPFKYESAKKFLHGIAQVRLSNKWGYINNKGKEITPFKYDEIFERSYEETDASVRVYQVYQDSKKKLGLIATNGKELTPAVYETINPFYEGVAIMQKNGMVGVLNMEGKEIVPARYSNTDAYKFVDGICKVSWNGKWGFIDKTGKEIIPLIYDRVNSFDADGTASVRQGSLSGRIDKTGKIIVPIKYARVEPLSDGFYSIFSENRLYGWADQSGKEIIAPVYEYGSSFVGGLAYVRQGKNFGVINKNNEIKIPLRYEYISRINEKLPLLYFKTNGKYGFFSESFSEITPAKYTMLYTPAQGRSFVRIDNKWGMVNDKGREITEIKFDTLVTAGENPFVVAVQNQKIGLLLNNGSVFVQIKYDNIFGFSEGMCPVLLNNKIGFVNQEGKEVIPPQFDDAGDFVDGKAEVKIGNQVYYIDKTGKKIQ